MGDVIAFGSKNKKKQREWQFTMEAYKDDQGRWSGEIVGFQNERMAIGDRVRYIAEGLEDISFHSYQYAEDLEPSERGRLVSQVAIFQNSDVRMRTYHPLITNRAQSEWLKERIDHAKTGVKINDGAS